MPRPVLGASVATGFDLRDGYARAVIPAEARQGVRRTASVTLPLRARDPVRLEDDVSHIAVSFALHGSGDATIATATGIATYAGALAGADVVHRVHAEGTEDYVVFEERPAKEEIAYDVDVSRVAGLRLVGNTLEFLDDGGAPRLRVVSPYVVDAGGVRSAPHARHHRRVRMVGGTRRHPSSLPAGPSAGSTTLDQPSSPATAVIRQRLATLRDPPSRPDDDTPVTASTPASDQACAADPRSMTTLSPSSGALVPHQPHEITRP